MAKVSLTAQRGARKEIWVYVAKCIILVTNYTALDIDKDGWKSKKQSLLETGFDKDTEGNNENTGSETKLHLPVSELFEVTETEEKHIGTLLQAASNRLQPEESGQSLYGKAKEPDFCGTQS